MPIYESVYWATVSDSDKTPADRADVLSGPLKDHEKCLANLCA
jgi:hypothetical protein